MQSFTDLKVWQTGLELIREVYHLTEKLPKEERYGLSAQVRKSSVSILANIAEGFGRFTYPDKANKYTIARGECAETETHVHVIVALKFTSVEEAQRALQLCNEVGRMISGLINSTKARIP